MEKTSDLVTKAELRAELTALEERMVQRFEGRMDAQEQRLKDFVSATVGEVVHNTETRLLQAFYGYAESTNQHFKQVDMSNAALLTRVSTLETRMLECEKRLNIPPAS